MTDILPSIDKIIKLWRIGGKPRGYKSRRSIELKTGEFIAKVEKTVVDDNSTGQYPPPIPASTDQAIPVSQRKSYENAHAYHINSISTCSDGETFISADDLRINWWNYDISDTCFSKLYTMNNLDSYVNF